MTDLIEIEPQGGAISDPHLIGLRDKANAYKQASKAENTLAAYQNAWADFEAWTRAHDLEALPATPAVVCLYLADQAETLATPTLRQRLAAIAAVHGQAREANPCADQEVKDRMQGIARIQKHQPAQAQGLNRADLDKMTRAIDQGSVKDLRDLAMAWTAFSGGLRRSEVVALDLADLDLPTTGAGAQLIRKSKTDQEGQGRHAALLPEAVAALHAWTFAAGIEGGAVFRSVHRSGQVRDQRLSPRDVARAFKRLALIAGLDADRISGHSARVGIAQDLVAAGAGYSEIAQACGWGGPAMPARYAAHLAAKRNAVARLLG